MSYLLPINESLNSSTDTQKKEVINKGTDTNNLCSCSYTKYLLTTSDNNTKEKFEENLKKKLTAKEQGIINIKNINILKRQNNTNYIHHTNYINQYSKKNLTLEYNKVPALISLKKPNSLCNHITSDMEKQRRANINTQLFKYHNNTINSNNNLKQKQNPFSLFFRINSSEINNNSNDNSNYIIDSNISLKEKVISRKAKPKNNFFTKLSLVKIDSPNSNSITQKDSPYKTSHDQGLLSKNISPIDVTYSRKNSKSCLRYFNLSQLQTLSPNYCIRNHIFPQLHLKTKHKNMEKNSNAQVKNIKSFLKHSSYCSNYNKGEFKLNLKEKLTKSPSGLENCLSHIKNHRDNSLNDSFKTNLPLLFKLNKVKIQFPKTPSLSSIFEIDNSLKDNSVKQKMFQRLNEYKRISSKSPL